MSSSLFIRFLSFKCYRMGNKWLRRRDAQPTKKEISMTKMLPLLIPLERVELVPNQDLSSPTSQERTTYLY